MRGLLCALALIASQLMAGAAGATCVATSFEDTPITYCEAEAGADLRLFLNDATGQPYGGFSAVDAALAAKGQHLAFAMNAGMFHPDQSPVGLYIEDGQQTHKIITSDGPGNFGLLPNGVFCIGDRFSVVESRAFAAKPPACRYASQSGPMLVIAGKLHPAFMPNSNSYKIRNGVGVSADGKVAWFAIADAPVTFDRFGRFFRDMLGARDALFFDGSISRLYAADLGRSGAGFSVGPIVGLVEGN
ncbi:MAG: phosphodiester glycosidase family protein [Cypionkella sp.]